MQDDLRELIESLKSHNVDFLVVGAHALAFYGHPRFTEDLDLFLRRSEQNHVNLQGAMRHFGIPISESAATRLMTLDRQMLVIGNNPNAVDLMTFLDGVKFEDAWQNREAGEVLGIKTWIIGKEDYIKTKVASGRAKDLLDLELLKDQPSEPGT